MMHRAVGRWRFGGHHKTGWRMVMHRAVGRWRFGGHHKTGWRMA